MFPPLRYPHSRRDPTVDVYHGVEVPDPYRWLEDAESAATVAWTDAENALTRQLLDGPARETVHAELLRLYDYERTSAPKVRGGRRFFTHNDGLQDQAALYVQEGESAAPNLLLDPNRLSADGTVALTGWEPSSNGRYLAYAISQHGSDWQELAVLDVDARRECGERLTRAKFVTMVWDRDSTGFYYTRFPDGESYRPAVWWHRLGTPQADDVRVFGPLDDPDVVLEVHGSSDHRYLAVTAFKGASEQSAMVLLDADRRVLWTIDGFEHAWSFIDAHGEEVYLRTNREAPRGRIVATTGAGTLREIVGEGEDILTDAHLAGGRLLATYLHQASARLRQFTLDGIPSGELALPALGSVTGLEARADDDEVFVQFASYTWPPSVLSYSLNGGAVRQVAAGSRHVDSRGYVIRQVWYPSRDGTRISMFLVHREGTPGNAARPVWLTGYGGFNINIVPDFDPGHFVWLERGGMLAVPNLRGGGEYGEAWHQSGMLARKQNVFDDCIAAAEWLVAEGYTTPGRIVFEGGSNGGLLVAGVLTQRPDLPGAVICRVPVADMLRYHLFTVGRFWIPEYGSSSDPDQFTFLLRYSPLHQVRDDVRYPPVLITTADTDDRVDPGMARKLAARLQEACAQSGGGPALIRIERRAGHGAGKPVSKMVDEDADIYAFALRALGLAE